MNRAKRSMLLAVLLAAAMAAMAAAQAATGTVTGTVRTSRGTPIASIRVVVASRADSSYTGRVTTDAAGSFALSDVPVGDVTLTVLSSQNRVIARGAAVVGAAGETVHVDLRTP